MKTQIPELIDISAQLDAIPLDAVPDEAEIDEAVRKRLTKDCLSLISLDPGEAVAKGDSLMIRVEGSAPKYNREKLPLTVGNYLYCAPLEDALIGAVTGETRSVWVDGTMVTATVLSAKRTYAPAPTDEMAEAQGLEDVHTIADYRAFLKEQMVTVALSGIVDQIIREIEPQTVCPQAEPEDLEAMKQLELGMADKYLMREKGVSLEKMTQDDFRQYLGCNSLEEFILQMLPMHKYQLKSIQLMCAAFGIEPTGDLDPAGSEYGAQERIFAKAMDVVMKKIEQRRSTR